LKAAFYCVADSRYFLGAVGLVNSLRLVGHREPIYLLDCGLDDEQRRLLEREVELVAAPAEAPPWLRKTVAPLSRPAEVAILVDADMVVTRPLGELIERAGGGRVIAFRDRQQRFHSEWGDLLGLGTARPGPYVSSGLVLCGGSSGRRVLELLDERQSRVDFELTFWRRNVRGYPFLYADQDVLNAILASRVEPHRVVALDQRLAPIPPFAGLRVVDAGSLRCAYDDGTQPYVVHHFFAKPWLEPAHHGVYSQLLRRLLVGPGIAIRVPERMIPLRLRGGPLAWAERTRVNLGQRWRFHVREPFEARRRAEGGADREARRA
jgi:hypothetical protein